MENQKTCNFCHKNNEVSQCSGCHLVYYCSQECQKSDWKQHKSQCRGVPANLSDKSANSLTKDESARLVKILKRHFINVYRLIYQISQPDADNFKARNVYFHNEKHGKGKSSETHENSSCCSSFFSKIYIPASEQSPLERCINELLTYSEFLQFSRNLLERLGATFAKIKEKGLKDKLPWDFENEQFVLHEVLREGVHNETLKEIKSRLQKVQKIDSKQPGLLATPSVWEQTHRQAPLDFLNAETIEKLVFQGFAFQRNFVNSRDFVRELYKELHYLSLESKFEEMIQEAQSRTDRCFWVSLNEIDANSFKNLHFLCQTLCALPYELNKKNTGFMAQISETFQVSCFNSSSFHKLHMDSSSQGAVDNGKTISCMYFCNVDADNKENFSKLRVFPRVLENQEDNTQKNEDFVECDMEWDGLFLLKSRKVGYEILPNDGAKRFVVKFWINGPVDIVKNLF